MAGANNICQTEAGTISDACLDEGNSFLQHAGSALSPTDVQPHDVQKDEDNVEPEDVANLIQKDGDDVQPDGVQKDEDDVQPHDVQKDEDNVEPEDVANLIQKDENDVQPDGVQKDEDDVQPHDVQKDEDSVSQPMSWSDLYEQWKKKKEAQLGSELYQDWKDDKEASLHDKEPPQESKAADMWSDMSSQDQLSPGPPPAAHTEERRRDQEGSNDWWLQMKKMEEEGEEEGDEALAELREEEKAPDVRRADEADNLAKLNEEDVWGKVYDNLAAKGLQDSSKLFEHVHKGKKMVGMMKKKRKKVHASSRLTEIEAMDCETLNQPLQVMRGPDGFDVKQLNIIDGSYQLQFSIPWSVGGYSDMNACSIHPVDSIMYCVVFAGAPYLVRVDSTPRMEYVARIPWGTYISGAFAPATGRFYVSTLNAEFLIIDNVISMLSYSSKDDAADLRSMKRLKAQDWAFTADCVAIDSDLEGNGIEEYIFSLYGPRLQIAKYDNTTKAFSRTWWIKVMPRRWDNIFGAGWGFQGKVFFAANRGSGVYEVPMGSFSLRPEDEFDDPDYMMQLNKLGDSDAIGINDGMNCLASASPWIVPFDCTKNSGPLQAFWRDAAYDLDMLDAATGNYTNVFTVPKDITDPPFRVLNAWAINPADTIVYACMIIEEWNDDIYPTPPPFYIVRVDDTKVRFIAKVQAPAGAPIAGAFGPGGTYYVVSNPSLMKFEDLASYTAYESYDDPDLPSFSEATNSDYITIRNMTGAAQIADVVAITADFSDGSGLSTWVMAANTALQLVLMKPSTGEYWVVPINDVLEGTELEGVWERQNMGAAWSFEGEVFFSTNDGAGVFQVPISEIKFPLPGSVKLNRVGPSASIHDNDGLNCVDRRNPWGAPAL